MNGSFLAEAVTNYPEIAALVGQLSQWLDGVLNYLPRVLVGLTIIGLGHMTGVLARYLVSRMSDDVEPTSTGPRIIHAAIVVIAVVMGLQHMKIDITFLTQLVLVALAVSGAGLALAFALGARQYVSNLVAQSEISRYAIGDRIRVDDVEGEIIEMTRSGVIVNSTEGLVSIPGARFLATNVVRLGAGLGDE